MRINRYLSKIGHCSRRQADALIIKGKVKINNKTAKLGDNVCETDNVSVNDKIIKVNKKLVYLAFNKPVGVIVTTDIRKKDNIINFINYQLRVFPVGRLDVKSSGLILLTNDGDFVNKILKAQNYCEKEYIVKVDKKITNNFLNGLENGVNILGRKTLKTKCKKINESTFKIILIQGLNRQIRRMCEKFGYNVVSLKRIRIKNLKLGVLPTGSYRELSKNELDNLYNDR